MANDNLTVNERPATLTDEVPTTFAAYKDDTLLGVYARFDQARIEAERTPGNWSVTPLKGGVDMVTGRNLSDVPVIGVDLIEEGLLPETVVQRGCACIHCDFHRSREETVVW